MGLEPRADTPLSMGGVLVPGRLFRAAGSRSKKDTNLGAQKPNLWSPKALQNLPKPSEIIKKVVPECISAAHSNSDTVLRVFQSSRTWKIELACT